MRARKVCLGLHLNQAAGRAAKLKLQAFAAIQIARRRRRRDNQLDALVVELVNQGNEAARCIVLCLDRKSVV